MRNVKVEWFNVNDIGKQHPASFYIWAAFAEINVIVFTSIRGAVIVNLPYDD